MVIRFIVHHEVIEPQDGWYELEFQKNFTETIVADFKSKAMTLRSW